MAYNKNLSINQNNVVNISGSQITLTGSLYGSQVSGTTAQFTSFTASNFQVKNDLYVSGGLTVGKYIQMLPVGALEIPANQTASYIYTSGSTNDLYFTQYQPGTNFTNTTRLRWLESTLSTGLLHGGVLSTVNGTTTFSLTSGSGLIVTYNASTSSDPYPTIQLVNWTASVSQSLTKVTASQISYISVAEDGEIIQSDKAPTFAEYKDRIFIGRVLHQSGSVTNGAINTPPTAYGLATSTADFIRAIGPLKINGHFLAASGSSLSLTKSAGDSYVEGRNYAGNPNIPNIIIAQEDPAVTVSKIYRQHVSGGNPVIDTGIANAGYVDVNPTKYQDANGNLINVGNANFSVQRVFWFPKAVNRALFVYYGQAIYTSIDDAIAGISTENFTEGDNTKGSAILVGFLVMRGNAPNFDTPSTARIYQASTFRGGGAGGGGGSSGGGTTLPAGSSSYVQFNDVGSFGADSRFTFDKISHTLTVTGTGSFSELTTGPLTASAAYISGNLTVTGSTTLSTVSGTNASFSALTSSVAFLATDGFPGISTGSAGERANIIASSSLYTTKAITAGGTGNGTATHPTYNFSVQPGTGMYYPANNTLAFAINSVESVKIERSTYSRLGVNEGNPSGLIHATLTTASADTTRIILENNGAGNTNASYDLFSVQGLKTRLINVPYNASGFGEWTGGGVLHSSGSTLLSNQSNLHYSAVTHRWYKNAGSGSADRIMTLDSSGNLSVSGTLNVAGNTTLTTITSSNGLIQGDLRILGTASVSQLNTIGQTSLLVGDKYITILSGGVDHAGLNGAGFLWGTSSGPGETTGSLGEHAHVLYDSSRDALQIFPGLYVFGNASVSGNLVVTGSIVELSTRNIKTNIKTVNNQLTTISKLNPVSYTRIDDGRKEYGFISEEVKEVYPEFVVGEGINYPKMVSVLVSAVKELTDKVEKQQNEIELLKNKKKTTKGKK